MFKERKILERIDHMLEEGINGTFEENNYDESQLSRLEAKWFRYLSSSNLSAVKMQQDREKLKVLVSDISHQTKTPLSNIMLYTQLLSERTINDETRLLAEEIQIQAEKLEFLIQALVKISRLETGIIQLKEDEADIESMIKTAIEQVRVKAEKKRIKISGEMAVCSARFDSRWTQEAVFNILDNAVKYSPEESVINISVKEYEMFSCIVISDHGPGISEEEIPRIFGRFYRGQNGKDHDGIGIGLYIARQIIEEQGGYITVESVPGNGTAFSVFLPK